MKRLKTLFTLLLTMTLVMAGIPAPAFAQGTQSLENSQAISISTAEELLLVGSNKTIDGITYTNDADYILENSIAISYQQLQQLDFTTFEGTITGADAGTTVYDAITDTLFIHNVYQLDLVHGTDEPVLSQDYDARFIGVGQVFETEDGLLAYDSTHNYIVASNFSLARPRTAAQDALEEDSSSVPAASQVFSTTPKSRGAMLLANAQSGDYPAELNGRDYFGEVVRQIGGATYILIGCQQQLRAIGTDRAVTEPIWRVYEERSSIVSAWGVVDNNPDYTIELYYPGDADLIKFDSTFDYSAKELFSVNNGGHALGSTQSLDSLTDVLSTKRYLYCGSKLLNGDLSYDESKTSRNVNIGAQSGTQRYSYDANYIVFRDIFLTQDGTPDTATVRWDPIDNFTGVMEGRLDMVVGDNPTINNVEILQNTNVDQTSNLTRSESEYGIGFFRSLVTPYDNVLSISNKVITVKDITLNNVSVRTTATGIQQDFSLVATILTPLLALLGMTSGVEKDRKSLATGAFVGVVRGKVEVSGCEVTNLAMVENANDWTGGFVGHTSGIAEYEALSGILGGLATTLQTVLNLVPILGLGDLIGVLLNGGILDVENLIPVAYTNAVFKDNFVSYTGSTTTTGQNHTGGFVGEAAGTVFDNCDVSKSDSLTVTGTDYVGGFAGSSENVVIVGALNELGLNLLSNFPVNTTMLDCNISGNGTLDVMATSQASDQGFAGGFVGRMANSYAIDCGIDGLQSVTGNDYVGGFAGYASDGEFMEAGANRGLVNIVRALLASILSGNTNAQLLNLIGLRPSVITGVDITGGDVSITAAGKYAGGIVGYAGAAQISNTDDLNDTSKTTSTEVARMLSANSVVYTFSDNRNSLITDSLSVTSTEAAGGAIGCGQMTGVAGVLDGTLSAVNYMRFELKELDLFGGNVEVVSTKAGGVIGEGVGGAIVDVVATGIASITGTNANQNILTHAGGFGGTFGSGTLANVGGVNLLGLNVVQIDNLASVSQVIETFAENCHITGIEDGFTVSSTSVGGTSGGFIGDCTSGKTIDCSVDALLSVTANANGGYAGGFVGHAKAGDALATVGQSIGSGTLSPLQISNLLGVASALRPEFHNSTLTFVDNTADQVTGDYAGGFIGYGEAVDINYGVNHEESGEGAGSGSGEGDGGGSGEGSGEPSSTLYSTTINNLGKVHGHTVAGGFAGLLQPGDIAQTGSVNVLGLLNVVELLSVMDVAYPRVSHSSITGAPLVVVAEGKLGNVAIGDAGGFIGNGKAVIVEHSNLSELASVEGTWHAGGYIGFMHSGTVAQAGDETSALLNGVLGMLLSVNELAAVMQAAASDIQDCKVTGVEEGFFVRAYPRNGNNMAAAQGYAGGYVGEMQSGHISNAANAPANGKGVAVENLEFVEGYRYAGGFGGKVESGAVVELGNDVSILTRITQATEALTLISAFVPEIEHASVYSIPDGCTVHVTGTDESDTTNDPNTGSAGGYIGYACGVQLTHSDVSRLKHTTVTEPADLQSTNGTTYYDAQASEYAVKAYKYAGGYFGKLDIGSTAAFGGTSLLNRLINLSSITSALEVVLSMVEDCDTFGAPGGFNVLATNGNGLKGYAGGFAGNIRGSQLRDCNSYNFAHIIGRVSAGGYVGTVEPGAVDRSAGLVDLLGGFIQASNLLGVLRSFIPEIINSETTCIPCGGVVRADAPSGDGIYRGLAGGYAGYNFGAQIWGLDYNEPVPKENAAIRIRSVYGYEYAGGYTGLMQCANVADTGSLSVLYGLVQLDNPLTLLQAVYPTEENTAVYGPLRQMDIDTWNTWVDVVAQYGPYGETLQELGEVESQAQLQQLIDTYAYGYAVTAGRNAVAQTSHEGSAAGGYVGRMEGGTITNGYGYDLRLAEAYRAAGGFAGEMITGDVANVSGVNLAGINIVGSLPLLQTFVPVIKSSSVYGYVSGATVKATGVSDHDVVGMAGGFAGQMIGGQIWGTSENRIRVSDLRSLSGTSYVGGFVGRAIPGSAVSVNTTSDTGLLHRVLNQVVGTSGDLADVLNATISTIRYVDVEAWDDYGLIVNGAYSTNEVNTAYATAAGGFAGMLSGTIVGVEDENNSGFNATNIRKVIAGEHAGGGIGLADIADVATISPGDTNLAQLIALGSIDLLSAFKTYVYHSNVVGSADAGLHVVARVEHEEGVEETLRMTGDAGGFAGALREGTVVDSHVTRLAMVEGLNYTGGFAGFLGKSGTIALNKIEVLGNSDYNLLGGSLGLIDIFGSHVESSTVTGLSDGYAVLSQAGEEPIAGGFAGYADLSRVDDSEAHNLKVVESEGTAGGFVGRTSFAYGLDAQFNSALLELLIGNVLNPIVRALYLADGTPFDLPSINILNILTIGLLYENNLVYLNLFGLPISIGLTRASVTDPDVTDFVTINIGDSVIKLPATNSGIENNNENKENLRISLIKANQTKVRGSEVHGVETGYDVYGADLAGGFVGFNDDGLIEDTNMFACDVIEAGDSGTVGPFSASSTPESHWPYQTLQRIEGNNNTYRVYRVSNAADIRKADGSVIAPRDGTFGNYSVYPVSHLNDIGRYDEYKGATIDGNPLDVYVSAQKAVLMDDTKQTYDIPDSLTPPPSAIDDICDEVRTLTINKIWKPYNGRLHPGDIHVTVHRSVTVDGQLREEIVPGFEDITISGDRSQQTWQRVLRNLPVYILDSNDQPAYYHYWVTEATVRGYNTSISEDEVYEGTVNITNEERPPVVPTGVAAIGALWIALLILLAAAFYLFRKKVLKGSVNKGSSKKGGTIADVKPAVA